MGEFRMPSLGADMEAGTLVEWVKQPGDAVARGDIIAVVETQKGAIEVEAFETGTFARALVDVGTTVPVGTPLAVIDTGTDEAAVLTETASAPEPAAAPSRAGAMPPPEPVAVALAEPLVAPADTGRVRASPAARRLAVAQGIELAGLRGSGPGGAIVSGDLAGSTGAAAPTEAPPKRGALDLGEMRKAIAAAMARSKRDIPHYYLETRIDLDAANGWLTATNADREPADRLLLAALLHKAAALALRKYPAFNGFYEDGAFRPSEAIHLGTAIAIRGGGLMAPAIHDADTLSLDDMMTHLRDLVARVRAGRIRGSEMMDPTVTITSLGERGADTVFGVIFPPQVAILGFGRPAPQLWPAPHGIETRLTVNATLAGDHRVSDGITGARLLDEIGRLLQEPDKL